MITDDALILQAIRLWPDNVYLQREWLRAVALVRSTRKGWLLDTHPIPQPVPNIVRLERKA